MPLLAEVGRGKEKKRDRDTERGWGRTSVHQVLATHRVGPEFEPPEHKLINKQTNKQTNDGKSRGEIRT